MGFQTLRHPPISSGRRWAETTASVNGPQRCFLFLTSPPIPHSLIIFATHWISLGSISVLVHKNPYHRIAPTRFFWTSQFTYWYGSPCQEFLPSKGISEDIQGRSQVESPDVHLLLPTKSSHGHRALTLFCYIFVRNCTLVWNQSPPMFMLHLGCYNNLIVHQQMNGKWKNWYIYICV